MHLPQNLLVPTDFSENADAALDYAIQLAGKLGAKVHVMSVIGPQLVGAASGFPTTATVMQELVQREQAKLDALIAGRAGRASFGATILETGDARVQIEQVAQRIGVDLIVMGTYGRRGMRRLLTGSVAEAVTRSAPCPVLLVRGGGV